MQSKRFCLYYANFRTKKCTFVIPKEMKMKNEGRKIGKINNGFVLCLFFFFLFSCTSKKHEKDMGIPAEITYASGFSIHYADDYTQVKVRNPWDTTQILHTYILVDKEKKHPENLPAGDVVEVPVENIACLSSIDASMLGMLGEMHKIKAMTETRYVKIPDLKKGVEKGEIIDIGEFSSVNTEKLMSISPEIIIVSPYPDMGYGKLETTGVAIVECAAYMETTPLGRAEWIRFIAAFLNKDKEAKELMDGIAERYHGLVQKTKHLKVRPTVFSEKKFGQVWYVPGGQSYMAHFYEDAGADYLWKDDFHSGSLTLDFETVYDKAENADFWIIKSDSELTYNQLKSESESYTYFKAWKDRKIIFSNTNRNNYYEEGVMNPDLVLSDLIRFFHPEIDVTEPGPKYFEWMKDE